MSSAAAKREEIQLRLQEVREQREREQAAFDAIAREHPDLSAQEITALAQQKARDDTPQEMCVKGVEVRVGDRVLVRDDAQLLRRADRGYFGPDLLKPVYLGERGEVTRVMASFQGKPAVELRFADGVAKVFFVECLDLDAEAAAAEGTGASRRRSSGGRAELTDVPVFVPPTKAPAAPPKAETLPGWSQIAMPHRKAPAGTGTGAMLEAVPPPPPPTVAALRKKQSPQRAQDVVAAPSPNAVESATPAATTTVTTITTSSTSAAVRPVASPPPPPSSSAPARQKGLTPVLKEPPTKTAAAAPAPLVKTRPPAVDNSALSVPPPPSSTPFNIRAAARSPAPPAEESLGLPSPLLDRENTAELARAKEDALELRPTPDSTVASASALAMSVSAIVEDTAQDAAPAQTVPRASAPAYQPKYELHDEASRIPRRQSAAAGASGARVCWVCGLASAEDELTAPVRVVFQAQCTAMFSLFAVLTRRLRWDSAQRTASRLFTEKGSEIKQASAVRDGMRLVATTGCAYQPSAHAEAFAAVPDSRPSPTADARPAETTITRVGTDSPTAGTPARSSAASTPATSPSASKRKAPSAASAAAPTPLSRRPLTATSTAAAGTPKRNAAAPPATSPSSSKPRHIRVYENGMYDDNIYRTVTVRPTYKTLTALKTTISRELQWRDGKKVDLLFDACGAEIRDLEAISDGDVVVASAGDRFVIPYPNTPMHLEAMKLSQRLDPVRKC